jgi:hypothetical protein
MPLNSILSYEPANPKHTLSNIHVNIILPSMPKKWRTSYTTCLLMVVPASRMPVWLTKSGGALRQGASYCAEALHNTEGALSWITPLGYRVTAMYIAFFLATGSDLGKSMFKVPLHGGLNPWPFTGDGCHAEEPQRQSWGLRTDFWCMLNP